VIVACLRSGQRVHAYSVSALRHAMIRHGESAVTRIKILCPLLTIFRPKLEIFPWAFRRMHGPSLRAEGARRRGGAVPVTSRWSTRARSIQQLWRPVPAGGDRQLEPSFPLVTTPALIGATPPMCSGICQGYSPQTTTDSVPVAAIAGWPSVCTARRHVYAAAAAGPPAKSRQGSPVQRRSARCNDPAVHPRHDVIGPRRTRPLCPGAAGCLPAMSV